MKKLILLILVLCCIISACGTVSEDYTAEPAETATAVSTGVFTRKALSKVTATVSGTLDKEPLGVISGSNIFQQNADQPTSSFFNSYTCYVLDENGQLKPIEAQLFNNAYTINGSRYRFSFDWVEYDGVKYICYSSDESTALLQLHSDSGAQAMFFIPEHLDTETGTVYTNYPVLLDFETGELTDFLSSCKLDNISNIVNAAFTPDRSGLLLAQDGGALYYCQLGSGTVYSLDELSSEPVKACTVVDNRLICWASGSSAQGNLGDYHFWYIDLDSFQRQELSDLTADDDSSTLRLAYLSGFSSARRDNNMYLGSGYALCTNGTGDSCILDMSSWTLAAISGYTLPASNIACVGNLSGDKLLLEDLENSRAYVLDYTGLSLAQLDVTSTDHLAWFGNDAIIEQSSDGNYYVYDLT